MPENTIRKLAVRCLVILPAGFQAMLMWGVTGYRCRLLRRLSFPEGEDVCAEYTITGVEFDAPDTLCREEILMDALQRISRFPIASSH